MTVERIGGHWWWGCVCGHFGYGHDYSAVLRAGVFHADRLMGNQ